MKAAVSHCVQSQVKAELFTGQLCYTQSNYYLERTNKLRESICHYVSVSHYRKYPIKETHNLNNHRKHTLDCFSELVAPSGFLFESFNLVHLLIVFQLTLSSIIRYLIKVCHIHNMRPVMVRATDMECQI